jgi:hypothetical protein
MIDSMAAARFMHCRTVVRKDPVWHTKLCVKPRPHKKLTCEKFGAGE